VLAGLPPLSGFVAKFVLITAALNPAGLAEDGSSVRPASWILLALLILSGLAALIAMLRAGVRAFWASPDRTTPRVRVIEMTPIAALLVLCGLQTIQAGPIMRFMDAAALELHTPRDYLRAVLQPVPGQTKTKERE